MKIFYLLFQSKALLSISFLILFGLLGSGSANSQNADSGVTVLKGATLFDGNGNRIEEGVIVVRDGKIGAIGGKNLSVPANAKVVELNGKFITPGLIDTHVHFSSTGFFDTRPNLVDLRDHVSYTDVKAYQRKHPERYFESYLRSGVTGVYDMGGPPWTLGLQERAENNPSAPHIAAAGTLIANVPPQFLSVINPPVEKEMILLESDSQAQQVVQYNTTAGSTGIKILGVPLDNEDYMQKLGVVAEEAKKRKNKLVVHANSLEEAKAALNLGAEVLVHGVRDKMIDEEFIELLKSRGAIYVPTMSARFGGLRLVKALLGEEMQIEDPNEVLDKKTREEIQNADRFKSQLDTMKLRSMTAFLEKSLIQIDSIGSANLKDLYEAGAIIAMGTDAGVPGIFHGLSIYEELERMQAAGVPADDLIVMATKNGAMAMERLEDFGTLEQGKMADLIILQKDPSEDISNMRSITHVMRSGVLKPVNQKFE